MKNTDQRKIEEMLLELVSYLEDSEEREEFLEWACRDDEGLRLRIVGLLATVEKAKGFFSFVPHEVVKEDDEARQMGDEMDLRIGRYRLLRRLGEGSHGVVYLAEQVTPVVRKVALKLLRVGRDSGEIIERFEKERQTLALMDHPGIARVLDAGSTSSGQPYLVIQWVQGEWLTRFCDRECLPLRERLELLAQVCRAVQHAHQKGIVHRDLKPSNILTDRRDGKAFGKIIDFGIAEVVADRDEIHGDDDFSLGSFGTPEYMSPEQASPQVGDIDTRSDIYSLGVILCEILVGRTPFGRTQAKTRRLSGNAEPTPVRTPLLPSQILKTLSQEEQIETARRCGMTVRKMERSLRDLDAIVARCLQNNREFRYESVTGLAMDLERFLHNKPVLARQGGRSYYFAKFFQRNRVLLVSGGLFVTTLFAGLWSSTTLFLRATKALQAEASLRQIAERRQLVSQAAVSIRNGQVAEAEKLLGEIPLEKTPSSLESVDSYAFLAEWHLNEGRPEQAAHCYASMVQALSGIDASESDRISFYLLPAATAACHVGDDKSYQKIKQIAVESFGKTSHPVVAEQVLKVCLLLKPDGRPSSAMEDLARIVHESLRADEGNGLGEHMNSWGELSLALYCYRNNQLEDAVHFADACSNSPAKDDDRTASAQFIKAMALFRSKQPEAALESYLLGCEVIASKPSSDSVKLTQVGWVNWIVVCLLGDEASRILDAGKSEF
ncbi:serine/threonine-protein kinase [Roseibacillus persicicus]|uniref:serine/threonine protein kinase n=1 Tax=Roseibacillus persicicus TaxID=454148 RepID=UPI00398BB871